MPLAICDKYYGVQIQERQTFAYATIAVSSHLFGVPPIKDDSPAANDAAAYIGAIVDDAVKREMDHPGTDDTIVRRLVNTHRTAGALPFAEVSAFLIGMITGFVPTNTLAGGHILAMLCRHKDFMKRTRDAALTGDDALLGRHLFEALRFMPINPGRFRECTKDTVIGGDSPRAACIRKGTKVLASTQSAMFDSLRIDSPREFNADRDASDYMHFGYGLHWCAGVHIARTQITQTFKALLRHDEFDAPGIDAKARRLSRPFHASIPEAPIMKSGASQAFVNVVIPFEPRHTDAVNAVLDGLTDPDFGNRPNTELKLALENMGIVHFMSMTAMSPRCPADDDSMEPAALQAHLMIEMVVDGGTEAAVVRLAQVMEKELKQVFEAGRIEFATDGIASLLTDHCIVIRDTWRGTLGQTFNGSPGQSLKRILREEKLARRIGDEIEALRREQDWVPLTPRERLDRIRHRLWDTDGQEASEQNPAGSRLGDENSADPKRHEMGVHAGADAMSRSSARRSHRAQQSADLEGGAVDHRQIRLAALHRGRTCRLRHLLALARRTTVPGFADVGGRMPLEAFSQSWWRSSWAAICCFATTKTATSSTTAPRTRGKSRSCSRSKISPRRITWRRYPG